MRLCLGCGQQRPKRELVRVVRTPDGEVRVDATGKLSGRGAYICPDAECLRLAIKNQRLSRALEAELPQDIVAALTARLEAAP
jgi:predicted RNA-binding protein YlxR (DUF448 family)